MSNVEKAIKKFREDIDRDRLFRESQAEIELCERMTSMRLAAGMTQVELAKRLGKTQAYVAKMENGGYDRCGIGTLRTFARAMGSDLAVSSMFSTPNQTDRADDSMEPARRTVRSTDGLSKVILLYEYAKSERRANAG